ncbi:hypothetical protein L6164_026418 [Bauhinia variegata]|uniref:Uncharacterized protein n=1 Tax=Bauhinia variegata TaxID=167791 RepID=A0ACB9LPV6_BAUVA|nr:hypothetical protein L6164_026418 [Bauhinia variegata]
MNHQPEIIVNFTPNSPRVNGAINRNSELKGKGKRDDLILAYKTLGVVFGGLATSPLYVFNSMALKSPTEDDYLSIFSIMFWTLTLIGIKYAGIALNAGDNGEGGTFALYSLLCRVLNIGILPSKRAVSDSIPYAAIENKTWLAKFFERSIIARRALLFIAMFGTCMMIGDGILTPAISEHVEGLSAAVLVLLFLMQRFGTSRVSFLFSPIMTAWTVTTPLVGIYRFIHHYPTVFKALSPHYIVHFFLRKGKDGWLLLSGIVLVITGSEAMFADLGHFNRRSIQTAFLFAIYPSLVLTYAGQTAYLIENPNDFGDGFYKFVPHAVCWPMFIIASLTAIVASQSLISATFSIIKQSVLLDYFPRVKIVHTSSEKEGQVYSPEVNYTLMILCLAVVLIFGNGQHIGNAFGVVVSWVMLITSILLILVMIMIWRTHPLLIALYAVVYIVMEGVYTTNKISSQRLEELLADSFVRRIPGICFFYTNIQDGLSPVLGHYLKNMKTLHQVILLTSLRYLLVPKVDPHERVVIRKLGPQGVYGCVIQYGYADFLDGVDDFACLAIDGLRKYIRNCDLDVQEIEEEISCLTEASSAGVVYVCGKTRFLVGQNSGWFERIMLHFYEVLHNNCRSALPTLGVPLHQKVEVGMTYEV